MSDDVQQRIADLVKSNRVVLFMKGTAQFPMCGFSGRAIQILKACNAPSVTTVNVLDDEGIRQGIKEYANWPTIPQLYIDGEYVDPVEGSWFESIDPYRGEAWARIPRAARADVDRAVAAAKRAMWEGPWATMTASARGKVLRRIGDLLRTPSSLRTSTRAESPPHGGFDGVVDFDRVGFRYQGSTTDALSAVDLHIPAGSSLALVGRTGAGKSTIVKLLARRPPNVVAVAIANKLARIAWALIANGRDYDQQYKPVMCSN